jgi:hypothetical protein
MTHQPATSPPLPAARRPQDAATPTPGPAAPPPVDDPGAQEALQRVRQTLAWIAAARARSEQAAELSTIPEGRIAHSGIAGGLHIAQLRLLEALDGPDAAVRELAVEAERQAAAHTCHLCGGHNPLACPGNPYSTGPCWCGLGTRAGCVTEPWGCGPNPDPAGL